MVKRMVRRDATEGLKTTIKKWFLSDLDIGDFLLIRGRKRLVCMFESDVWYEHIGNPTFKTIRHKGEHRRLIVIEGDDGLFEEVKSKCYTDYDMDQLLQLVDDFSESFRIAWDK